MGSQLTAFAMEFWHVMSEMAPYLLFGFLVAGILSVAISQRMVERHLGGGGMGPVVKASLFGIPLPLCSCGVIPVAASIRRQGASRGATASFLLSTPQTGVDSIFVTFSLMGLVFAVFRPIAALFTGLVGGGLVNVFTKGEEEPKHDETLRAGACGVAATKSGSILGRVLRYGFYTLPADIGRSLLVGLVIAGVIAVVVPEDFFAGFLHNRAAQMLLMLLFGIPIYVCATASVPVAAVLWAKGLSAGAVLVFLMTGPASNAATITTIWRILGKRTALIYLGTVVGCALGFGILLDLVYTADARQAIEHIHWQMPALVRHGSSFALIGILGYALLRPMVGGGGGGEVCETGGGGSRLGGSRLEIPVSGMTCSHCADAVRRAIIECPGVESVTVDLKKGIAGIEGEEPDVEAIRSSVEGLGYSVGDIKMEQA